MTPQSLQTRLSNIRPHLDLNADEAKVLATLMHGKESMFKSAQTARNALSGLEWKLYQAVGRLPKWDADALDTFIRLGEHSLHASGILNPIANAYEGGDKVRLSTSYRSGKGVQVDRGTIGTVMSHPKKEKVLVIFSGRRIAVVPPGDLETWSEGKGRLEERRRTAAGVRGGKLSG